jgi:hypothetical protein
MTAPNKCLADYLLEAIKADPPVFTKAQWRTLVTLRHEFLSRIPHAV